MPKAENIREFLEHEASHDLCMLRMEDAAREQGNNAVRSLQVWQQLIATLEENEVLGKALKVQAKAVAAWANSKVWQAQALDATAAAIGTTRQALLDELAAVPSTIQQP